MALIYPNLINNQIDLLGELVTITVKSSKTYSDWGDEASTETETSDVKAVFNVYGKPRESNDEGKFLEGDLTFFFKSDQSGIENGTKVTRANGEVFQISDPMDHGIQGTTQVQEAKVERV